MAKYLTEFIGTFFLVFTIGLVSAGNSPLGVLAIGIVLMCMVYMGGHISGAHYNPAVTLAVFMRGRCSKADLAPYIVSQLAGAIVAALISSYITGKTFAPMPAANVSMGAALLTEVLYTFALALVVLNVATSDKTSGNSYYGLAIGFTIVAAALAGGPISGGAFNPAVGLGPTIIHSAMGGGDFSQVWLYVVGPCIGGAIAAITFKQTLQSS